MSDSYCVIKERRQELYHPTDLQ